MYYALRDDNSSRPLVLGTCDGTPDVTTLDYAKTHGWKFYTLEEAVARGAMTRNKLGKEIWLGVNIKIKMDDMILYAWWLGKWRTIACYNRRDRRPSDKWINEQLARVLRVNIPLDPETVILFHWSE